MFNFVKRFLKLNQDYKKNINLIRNSKYFDEEYYKLENPRVKGDLCKHYYNIGWKEGKAPSYYFSTNYYLKNNNDVMESGINPLIHYLKSGQFEKRKIAKENGVSVEEFYQNKFKYSYIYKLYFVDTDKKSVNLFFDKINDDIYKMTNLIKFVFRLVEKNNYNIRIIYTEADFDKFNDILEKNNINLPKDILFLNLKDSNYLEVGNNDIYISTVWKATNSLLNNSILTKNIYFYIDTFDSENILEKYYFSKICNNNKVICLTENKKNIDFYYLNVIFNNKKINIKDKNNLYCDFGIYDIIGIELLNELFLNNILDYSKWKIKLINAQSIEKFHLDMEILINNYNKIEEDATLLLEFGSNKNLSNDFSAINISIESKTKSLTNFINILESDNLELITKKSNVNHIDNNIIILSNIIKNEKR